MMGYVLAGGVDLLSGAGLVEQQESFLGKLALHLVVFAILLIRSSADLEKYKGLIDEVGRAGGLWTVAGLAGFGFSGSGVGWGLKVGAPTARSTRGPSTLHAAHTGGLAWLLIRTVAHAQPAWYVVCARAWLGTGLRRGGQQRTRGHTLV